MTKSDRTPSAAAQARADRIMAEIEKNGLGAHRLGDLIAERLRGSLNTPAQRSLVRAIGLVMVALADVIDEAESQ